MNLGDYSAKSLEEKVRGFVLDSLERWHINGASVAVIKDGKQIVCDGYGLRDREQSLAMTRETIMPIASCTKAFTSMCIGMLVDEAKLDWDKPLRTWLPTFKMYDDIASEHMTPRDLLCHRSGLPRHDTIWYCSNFNRQEIFDRLRYLEPNSDFRSAYYYQNMMFMVAGLLVGAVAGNSWEAFVQERIFNRLGMRHSNLSTVETQNSPDHGEPYIFMKNELRRIPYYEQDGEKDALGPAGNICSCVGDLSRWIQLHLNGGKLDGEQIISTPQLEQMHKPHIFINDPQVRDYLGMEFFSYGLGWYMRSVKGNKVISHGGNMDGFASMVSFVPKHGIGVVVLSNGDGYYNEFPAALSYSIYDHLLKLEETDWNTKYIHMVEERVASEQRSEDQSSEDRKPAPPSHPIQDYLGEYSHPGYGRLSFQKVGDALQLVINDKVVMPVSHYHFDTFEAYLAKFDWRLKLSFTTDLKGNIDGIQAQMEAMVPEITFARLPDPRCSDPAFLEQFTGEYVLLGMPMWIRLAGGKLFAHILGANYEVEPYLGLEFKAKNMTGHGITFQAGEDGICRTALVTQPGSIYLAERKPGAA